MEAAPGMRFVQVPEDATVLIYEARAEGHVTKAADIAAEQAAMAAQSKE